jgi:acyl-CoA thioester hydrolase
MSLVSTAARPHPDRLSPTLYPVRSTIEARFGDMDANRHLNNLALEAMHENARADTGGSAHPVGSPAICGVRPD